MELILPGAVIINNKQSESGDPREKSFLFQRLSIIIQRYNANLFSRQLYSSCRQ